MNGSTYKDKKGRVLRVAYSLEADSWNTYYLQGDGKGDLRRLIRKELPNQKTQEQAQQDLDAYAIQHELETVERPDVTNPQASADADGIPPAVETSEEAAEASAAASPSPEELEAQQDARLIRLREELQALVEEGMQYKARAAADAAHWRAQLKDVDERIEDLLDQIHVESRPIPNALPFDKEPEAPAGETTEPTTDDAALPEIEPERQEQEAADAP